MTSPFDQLNEDQLNALMDLAPEVGTQLGLVERDDRWPDGSDAGRDAVLAQLKGWEQSLAGLNADGLTPDQRLEREVFSAHLKLVDFAHTALHSRRHDPDVLSQVGWTLLRQMRSTFVPPEQRFLNLKERLRTLGGYLGSARRVVTEPDALWMEIARNVAAETPALVAAVRTLAGEAEIPDVLKQEVNLAAQQANEAVAEHQQWLRELSPSSQTHWVIGEDRFRELCKLRGLPSDPADLTELGTRYLEEYRIERKRAAARLRPGQSVDEAMQALRSDLPADFDAALGRVRLIVAATRAFIVEKELVPMPPNEQLDVMETPAPLRPLIPFAALMPAPKYAAQQTSVYLVTAPLDGSLKDFSAIDVENTAIHEGYPGHHLQQTVANQATGLLRDGVPLGYFADPSSSWATETVEGWAHYCEEMMREEGFEPGPAARLQIAHDAVWRAQRVIIDAGLMTGRMTVEQAMQRLIDDVGMSKEAARAEVWRYTRNPGYQLCYLLGKHQIFELRRRAAILWRENFSVRRFHDLMLGMGNVPLRFVHARLEPLPPA